MVRRQSEDGELAPRVWKDSDESKNDEEYHLRLNPADKQWVFLPLTSFAKRKRKELQRFIPGLSVTTAKRCYAFICGHRNWHAMERAWDSPQPFPMNCSYDEGLDLAQLEERHAFQTTRAMLALSLSEQLSRDLINRLRPSAQRPPLHS
jgi:hypothetical protein